MGSNIIIFENIVVAVTSIIVFHNLSETQTELQYRQLIHLTCSNEAPTNVTRFVKSHLGYVSINKESKSSVVSKETLIL